VMLVNGRKQAGAAGSSRIQASAGIAAPGFPCRSRPPNGRASVRLRLSVRKTPFWSHFDTNDYHFTKTGSGQT
jgi:hypothetical protein